MHKSNHHDFMQKLLLVSSFLTALFVLLGFQNTPRPPSSSNGVLKTIVIDAGHGGKDPGCLGKNHYEKDIALSIALEFGQLVERLLPDIKIIYTRKTDVFVPLIERAKIANKAGADLFISIHCNANLKKDRVGTETYVMGVNSSKSNLSVAMRENAVIMKEANYRKNYKGFDPTSSVSHILLSNMQNIHQTNSLLLASKIEKHFYKATKRHSRGVKQSGFWVLAQTGMPSILVETGFLTTPSEEKYLSSEAGQTYIASSLYRALRDYKRELEGKW